MEIDFPLGRIDAALFDWEQVAARPEALKDLQPKIESLSFDEGIGFNTVYSLKRDFEYQMNAEIQYNPVTKTLMAPRPGFKETAAFLPLVERDARARVMLSNNASGLLPYIRAEDAANTMSVGYPQNKVKLDRRVGRFEYLFNDDLRKLKSLPEIKAIVKDAKVKAFLQDAGDSDVRVKLTGSEKTGFAFVLMREGDRRLEGQLLGRRVTIKTAGSAPAPSPAR